MSMIAVCSIKGAPGATTLAMALASALADRSPCPPVLVEADLSGGSIAASVGLPVDPGMATLAAAHRHRAQQLDLADHVQALPAGGDVLVGPFEPGLATMAVGTIADRLSSADAGLTAVVDCGRLVPGGSTDVIVRSAAWTLVCLRPDLAGIESVRARSQALRDLAGHRVVLVAIGRQPYTDVEIEGATGIRTVTVPFDRRAAEVLVGKPARRSYVQRLPLVRAARSLADQLALDVAAADPDAGLLV